MPSGLPGGHGHEEELVFRKAVLSSPGVRLREMLFIH